MEGSIYSWGLDGYGRCHLCGKNENVILFCGLPGVSGVELVLLYEDSHSER
jgi:hypothetical protein